MLHPSTALHVLNVRLSNPCVASISKLFQCNITKAERQYNGGLLIDLSDSGLKVTDWYGWTEILSVMKSPCSKERFFVLEIPGKKPVIVSEYALIPIYNPNSEVPGFHGSVKYEYTLKNPEKIQPGDYVRARRLKHGTAVNDQFGAVTVTPLTQYDQSKLNQKDLQDHKGYCYQIFTKSKFFNGNDYHLYGSPFIEMNDVEKWYK